MAIGRTAFFRTTTLRLALVNFVLFALFSVVLLAFLYTSTVGFIEREANRQIEAELDSLGAAYGSGGFTRLSQAVAERAPAPGPYFYYLQAPDGTTVFGDFTGLAIPTPLPGETKSVPFNYNLRRSDGSVEAREAEGRAVRLSNGGVLLVAFDWAERVAVVNRITRTLVIAAPIGLVLSLVGAWVIARFASRKADKLARTAEDVMAGDLARRAPVNNSGDEFDRLAERLNTMLAWLERLVNATRETGNAIAHDLRSPLTHVRNRVVKALETDLDTVSARNAFADTLDQIDQMLTTFDGILRLSRLEAGAGVGLARLDVTEITETVADLFEPACEEKGMSFVSEIEPGLAVLGDAALLQQALTNLIDNAIKYGDGGDTITLFARRMKSDRVALGVSDTGPGIKADDRARAVKRFERLDPSRTEPGSGLGLALVAAIADHHSGQFVLGEGSGPDDRPGLSASLILQRAK